MTDERTPTPWEVQGIEDDDGHFSIDQGICFIIGSNLGGLVAGAFPWPKEKDTGDYARVEANAAFIVCAVNAHDKLVEALQRTRGTFLVEHTDDGKIGRISHDGDALKPLIGVLDEALSLARGEPNQ